MAGPNIPHIPYLRNAIYLSGERVNSNNYNLEWNSKQKYKPWLTETEKWSVTAILIRTRNQNCVTKISQTRAFILKVIFIFVV